MSTGRLRAPALACWLLVLAMALAPCHARADAATEQLIHATGLDAVAALGMPRSLYPRAGPAYPDLVKAQACVADRGDAAPAAILADAARTIMSPSELQAGRAFFSSALGKKYRALTIWQARADLGLDEDAPVPHFSKQEEEEVMHFLKTPAGMKLTVPLLLGVRGTPGRLYELTIQIVSACMKAPGK